MLGWFLDDQDTTKTKLLIAGGKDSGGSIAGRIRRWSVGRKVAGGRGWAADVAGSEDKERETPQMEMVPLTSKSHAC